MTNRKQFMESVGATCANWQWSWSFVNHAERFVVFGLWDINESGLIFDVTWKGRSHKQSLEHIRLIREEDYALKTFKMEWSLTPDGKPKIKSIETILADKRLTQVSGNWYAISLDKDVNEPIAEEVSNPERYFEGATTSISVNAYERNPKARKKCLEHYGYKCFACLFDFEEAYGDIGRHFIHVHHERALAEIRDEYEVDPINDLKPLCPNCHAIVHRTHPPLKVGELMNALDAVRNKK